MTQLTKSRLQTFSSFSFSILQDFEQHKCDIFSLYLPDVKFPNFRIKKNWWTGGKSKRLGGLYFARSRFEVIERDAFSAESFASVYELQFIGIKSLKCLSGWSNGFQNLFYLTFTNSMLVDVRYDFLQNVYTLQLNIYLSLKDTRIVNLFGSGFTIDLGTLHIEHANYMNRIRIMDFSGLKQIKSLLLIDCGIEVIDAGVFSSMHYLEELSLSRNKLKTLPTAIFDCLMERRDLVAVFLDNNHWECFCELAALHESLFSYGIMFEDFPADCRFEEGPFEVLQNDNHKFCKASEEDAKESICQKRYGFNLIFVSYPRISLHMDDLLENMHIAASPDQGAFYSLRIYHENHRIGHHYEYVPPVCRVFGNRTAVVPIGTHRGKCIVTYCIIDSQSNTGIWPLNCITFCQGCNENIVWLRMRTVAGAIGLLTAAVMATMFLGTGLAFLLIWWKPTFLTGADRVVVLRSAQNQRRSSVTVFVMPHDWINPKEADMGFVFNSHLKNKKVDRRLGVKHNNIFHFRYGLGGSTSMSPGYNGFKIATKPIQDYDEINEYTKCPPLPPRPIRNMDPKTKLSKCQEPQLDVANKV